MKKSMKKTWWFIILIAFLFLATTLLIRANTPRQIDDVTPGIYCEQNYLEKADELWVIPNYNNTPISENPEWCNHILSLNKTIEMHGVKHYYPEFRDPQNLNYLEEGIQEFQKCFNQTPTMFKPPKLEISKENKLLLRQENLKLKRYANQFFHKVYHCSDTGTFPNKFHDIF